MNFGGFLGLLIGIILWLFIIAAVVLAVISDFKDNSKKENKA